MSTLNIEYRGLDKVAERPMTEDESKLFIALTFAEMNKAKDLPTFSLREILQRRVTAKGLPLEALADQFTYCFLSGISKNPAHAVMWFYTLLLWRAEDKQPMNLERFARHKYPWGIPTDDALHEAWEKQKVRDETLGDNQLDRLLWIMPLVEEVKQQLETSTTNEPT